MHAPRLALLFLATANSFQLSPTPPGPPPPAHLLRSACRSRGAVARPILAAHGRAGRGELQLTCLPQRAIRPLRCGSGPGTDQTPADEPAPADMPPTSLFMLITGLQVACFGCIGTALPPALHASGLSAIDAGLLLGRLGSASAFAEVMLSGSFGKLADAIGRKPILVCAPAITVAARALVVLNPSLPVLISTRLVTTLVVPIYWLAFSASIADCYGRNATQLAIVGSRNQAAMGFGYAISSLAGGWLAAKDIRYAYFASCILGCCVLACHLLLFRETLPASRRIRFKWSGSSPLSCIWLFRRGALSAKLNSVVLLQSVTNGMGDLWQVLARELRGWGADQCGRFAALAGISSMLGTLLTGPSIRKLGPRGHTIAATAANAATSCVLATTSNAIAYGGVVGIGLGAGKGHALSAKIVNLGHELGVPQGQLSAERNTLNAIIKVVAPSLYAWLFAVGTSYGVLGLPFYATAFLLACSALLAASIPADLWQSSTANPSAPVKPQAAAGAAAK